ncbi:MAG TPA: hypothetical protein VHY37_07600 [Tepidisphaeraceae bacterium]|jgi:hypothetical protein|nr:hypothetical protein [Tepidisphaeraceae bacterium]
MKIVSNIARCILGVMFTLFGLNGFFNFLKMPPLPPLAVQFLTALAASHYLVPIFLLQIVCGLVFLSNHYIPLALAMIAPVIVNILLFHALTSPTGIGPGLLATACWLIVFYRYRRAFAGVFRDETPKA